ncbi:MAG: penicillin acylase family protein [Deltaproteobacteria bacterium]|nr:penicillin acylase family protein [Deltaproteobacteria bacterium]
MRWLHALGLAIGLVVVLGGCGDDDGDGGPDGAVDSGGPDSTPPPPPDSGTDGGPDDAGTQTCEENPLGEDCPTCEDDPDQPWCLTCEEDPSLPDCDFAEPTFAGLSAPVELVRDATGVPHVYGQTDADAMFGSGYAQARDRLFQMELRRRQAMGRQAELFGESKANEDELIRRMGLYGLARWTIETMRTEDPELLTLLVAWTAGVNRRIEEVRSGAVPLPYGFGPDELDFMPETWSVVDAAAVGKLLLFGNANLIEFELLATVLREYVPDLYANYNLFVPLEERYTMPPEERPTTGRSAARSSVPSARPRRELPPDALERIRDFARRMQPFRPGASNNWAVDGRHTDNGRPLVASDPHQPLRSPSLFWVHHVNSADAAGAIDVIGFNFVGTPAIQLGHNRRVAWAATTTYPDTQDFLDVRVEGGVAMVGGRGIPILAHEETIQIAGADPRTITIERVPGFGVLMAEDFAPVPLVRPGHRILYTWTGFRPTHELQAFFGFDTAESLADYEAAVDVCELCMFNWLAADATGITYRSSMLVPIRAGELTFDRLPYTMLDGDDPGALWSGEFLPGNQLMRSRGGTRGWLATANNDPFGFTEDGEVVGDPWYYGVFFDPGTRAARIEDELARLTERGDVSVADMQALQTDTHSILGDHAIALLEEVWARVPTDPALAEFRGREDLERLVTLITEEWDRRMVRDSSGAVAFEAFVFLLASRAVADDFALIFEPAIQASPITFIKWALLALEGRYENAEALLQEGRELIVVQALADAADWLTERFGGVDPAVFPYSWGMIHGTRFSNDYGGRLDGGWVPTDGGDGTVNVSEASFFDERGVVDRLESGEGPIYRTVYSFAADGTPEGFTNFPRGISGEPDSPLWDHTLEDWIEGRYRPLAFRREVVEAEANDRVTLSAAE